MKRKSIFLTVVAVFLASVAWGQEWPKASEIGDGLKFVGADTIYFCAPLDSLYPIELGVDVLGKKLSPEFGDWSLYATTSGASINDYAFNVTIKNGGAGNAFRVVGSGIGGYIFQYVAKDEQCSLEPGEIFLSYVFILPDNVSGGQVDSIKCKAADGTTATIKSENVFKKKYLGLYDTAKIEYEFTVKEFHNVRLDSVSVQTFTDKLIIKSPIPAGYTCGTDVPFTYRLTIVDTVILKSKGRIGICATDTVTAAGKTPYDYFDYGYPVTYSPATLAPGNVGWNTDAKGTWKRFVGEYTNCKSTDKYYVYDTLFVQGAQNNWGEDTVSICRVPNTLSIFSLYDSADYSNKLPAAKWPLTESNSSWVDWGVSLWSNPVNYGTVHGYTSLKGTSVLIDSLKSNVGYNYQWFAGGIECAFGPDGNGILKPDSGVLVVYITDPFIAQDYTAQLCQTSYSAPYLFDLAKYTGISAEWKDDNNAPVSGNLLDISKLGANTYKYHYSVPASTCGPGGKGVFYIKVAKKVKVSSSKTVVYCSKRLPASINLSDVLNVAVGDIEWKYYGQDATGSPISVDGLSSDGYIDIDKFVKDSKNVGKTKFVFKVESGGCVSQGTTLTIEFLDTI
jgi:hypothetical protein